MRESGGGLQHLVVKKITDEPEEWNQAGAEADWDTTMESLRRKPGREIDPSSRGRWYVEDPLRD
jgi:hypothetical protein